MCYTDTDGEQVLCDAAGLGLEELLTFARKTDLGAATDLELTGHLESIASEVLVDLHFDLTQLTDRDRADLDAISQVLQVIHARYVAKVSI